MHLCNNFCRERSQFSQTSSPQFLHFVPPCSLQGTAIFPSSLSCHPYTWSSKEVFLSPCLYTMGLWPAEPTRAPVTPMALPRHVESVPTGCCSLSPSAAAHMPKSQKKPKREQLLLGLLARDESRLLQACDK